PSTPWSVMPPRRCSMLTISRSPMEVIETRRELGARKLGDHRCEGLHRLARHHDVREAPPLAALEKLVTQFVRGAEQDDRKLERVLTRKAEHGCGASGSAAAGDDSGGEGHNLELD